MLCRCIETCTIRTGDKSIFCEPGYTHEFKKCPPSFVPLSKEEIHAAKNALEATDSAQEVIEKLVKLLGKADENIKKLESLIHASAGRTGKESTTAPASQNAKTSKK